MSDKAPLRVLLGVTGSTAATKAQSVASGLRATGCEVRAAMSPSATKFISPLAIASVLDTPVYTDMWNPAQVGEIHIEWAKWADVMVIAPATASVLASLWLGTYDSPVTLLAASIKPERLFVAPGMAQEMWDQPAVKRNVAELKSWGVRFLGPVIGRVASGGEGQRLMEPRDIVREILAAGEALR